MEDFLNALDADHWLAAWLLNVGVPESLVPLVALGVDVTILIFLAVVSDILTKRVILRVIERVVKKSSSTLDDVFFEKRVFDALAHIAPALVINVGAPLVFNEFPGMLPPLFKIVEVYIIGVLVWVTSSFLDALLDLSQRSSYFKDKPILSYVQLGKLITYMLAGVLIFSVVFSKSPIVVISAFGAVAAVLIFVFKDTILGLVASIQISANDMLRVGDWVSMEKYGADGDVIKITLNTIVVQNWDKTISTIPAYAFVSDSFKNWRGMSESGGRRIKRALNFKITSVRFCDQEMLDRFKKFDLLHDYLIERESEIQQYNEDRKVDKTYPINGRHLTNIGIFRLYAELYLSNHPKLRTDMTHMVRQLSPTEIGIPVEIYCFTGTVEWLKYEAIQSDIFDHLMASASLFDLEIFQSPSGSDFRMLTN